MTNNPVTPESNQGDNVEWEVRSDSRGEPEDAASGTRHELPSFPPFTDEDGESTGAGLNLDLRRYIIGAWQRRYLGLTIMLVVTLLMALLIAFGVSKQWQSATTLIKRSHQDRFSLADRDPFRSQDYSLATLLDTLKLPSSLNKVAEKANLNVSPTTLATALGVSLSRDSTILNLKVTWNDPVKAAELADLVAEQFIDRTRVLVQNDAAQANDYYSSQLDNTRIAARVASEEVMAFRQEYGISDLDTETKVLLEELSRLRGEYNTRQAETDALRVAQQKLQAAIQVEPEQVIMYTIYRSPLKTRLADYEWELQEALAKYTAENPKVVKLKERIRSLEKMIGASNDEEVPENTYTQSGKRLEMELRLQQLGDDIRMREAQSEALESTLQEMQHKVAMLSSQEKDYVMLQSRLDGILSLENQLARRVEETRLVMQRNDAGFDIVERASTPVDPLPSGRKLLAVASLVFATGCGFILVLLLECNDPFVRSLRDVSDIVGHDTCVEVASEPDRESHLVDKDNPIGGLANLYRRLCNDMDAAAENPQAPVGVVSINAGDGRSTVAANLAMTRVMKGQGVLLVDADLRKSAGSRPVEMLGIGPGSIGLYEYLTSQKPLAQNGDATGKLHCITAAAHQIDDDKGLLALGATDLDAVISTIGGQHQTFVDLPPVEELEVTLELAARLGDALLVVRSGKTRREDLKNCVNQMNKRGIDCVATILLDVPETRLESANIIALPDIGQWLRQRFHKEPSHA
jgi:uncharacterized protein involved in exopolysaccharide biosynthesis/MinD-like ATPase involved in chromosome partitioning or flagellar assembly